MFDAFRDNSLLDRVSASMHWFGAGEILFPETGEIPLVGKFGFMAMVLPFKGYSVWSYDFMEHVLLAEP
ncbi:MAG: hypothetical protein R6V62_06975 [Candidatus Fermentibacteraceae bacterium]